MLTRILKITAAGFAIFCAGPAAAAALEVAPTTIELDPRANTAVLYVSNRGTETATVQIEGLDWRQVGGADQLATSNTLLVSPPMARIKPGLRQTVRLMVNPGGNPDQEESFRLMVSELPEPAAKPMHGVRVLLQFSVPVFIVGAKVEPPQLTWDLVLGGDGLSLIAHNDGAQHIKLSGLTLVAASNRIEVAPKTFSYILAGASHSWKIARAGLTPGESVRIEGRDESAGAPIAGTLIIHR